MGLFNRKPKQQEPQKPSYYVPADATLEWFSSEEAKKLFEEIRKIDKAIGPKYWDVWYTHSFWFCYIGKLPNILALDKQRSDDSHRSTAALHCVITNILTAYSVLQKKDVFGDTVWSLDYEEILNSAFAYYAAHVKFPMTTKVTKIVLSIILNNDVNTETETWLYDAAIFDFDDESRVLENLTKIIEENDYEVDLSATILQ